MKNLFYVKTNLLIIAIFSFIGCQQPNVNVQTANNNQATANNANSNGNVNVGTNENSGVTTNINGNSTATSGNAVEANEPGEYRATVTLKLEAAGAEKKTALPNIVAQVARSGDNRRMEFALPSGEKIVYLDLGGKQFIVAPQRKEYGEINKESVGIDVRRLLTPAQIISQIKSMRGVEKVGEEKYNGRDAVKYQYKAVTNTQTKAGNVDTSSIIYVDKETGLPLHSETSSVSENSSVNGMNNMRFVTEMTDIQTTADAKLFAEPTDYKKVEPQQIRGQLETVFNVIGNFIGQMIQQQQTQNANSNSAANATK